MKIHLFYSFLFIFVITSIVTLLGVTNVISIREGYLTALVSAFLIELAGAVIAIFKTADFFGPENNPITKVEEIHKSIKKLDTSVGYLHDRLEVQQIHFQSQLLVAHNLPPTPRTDIMVLVSLLQGKIDKIHPEVVNEALGAIASVLEANIHIGTTEKASLISLCKLLPPELTGVASRVLHSIESQNAQPRTAANASRR